MAVSGQKTGRKGKERLAIIIISIIVIKKKMEDRMKLNSGKTKMLVRLLKDIKHS